MVEWNFISKYYENLGLWSDELEGSFVVVSPGHVRFRRKCFIAHNAVKVASAGIDSTLKR